MTECEARHSCDRGAHDGDAPGRAQQLARRVAVEDGDRIARGLSSSSSGAPCSVDIRRAGAVASRRRPKAQDGASFWYGRPTAAGGMLRPTTPARMTMVIR